MKGFEKVFACVFTFTLQVSVSGAIPRFYSPSDTVSTSPQLLKTFSKSLPGKCAGPHEPPQYMLDLYNKVADSRGLTKSPLPHGASLVRAVPVQVMDDRRFSFSMEGIPWEETILEAEIHIHHHQLSVARRRRLGNQTLYQFNLFTEDSEGGLHRVLSHPIGAHFSGWRASSVGAVVKAARARGGRLVFAARASSLEGESIDARLYHGRHRCVNQPLLVLFNRASNGTELRFDPPNLPNKDLSEAPSNRVTRSITETPEPFAEPLPSGCVLRSLFVDFERIGWGWVVYPKSYDAHQCVGLCSFPLSQDLHPSNHATVVSIVHYSSGDSGGVQNPLCVPTGYKNLALLYYDVEDTVILKQFDRMVATQCGCR